MSSIVLSSLIRFCRAWAFSHQPRFWSHVVVKSTPSGGGRDVGVSLDGVNQTVYWDSSIIPRVGSSCFVVQDSRGRLVGFNGSQDLQLKVDVVKANTVPKLQGAERAGSVLGGLKSVAGRTVGVVVIIKGVPYRFDDPRMDTSNFEAVLVDLADNKYAVPVYLPSGYSIVNDAAFDSMIRGISRIAGIPCPPV